MHDDGIPMAHQIARPLVTGLRMRPKMRIAWSGREARTHEYTRRFRRQETQMRITIPAPADGGAGPGFARLRVGLGSGRADGVAPLVASVGLQLAERRVHLPEPLEAGFAALRHPRGGGACDLI